MPELATLAPPAEIMIGDTHKFSGKTRVFVRMGERELTIIATKSGHYDIHSLAPNPNYGKIGHSNAMSHIATIMRPTSNLG